MSFYEISDEEKLNNEDLNFIEKEFNDIMFEDRYKSLFAFPDFKEFIKFKGPAFLEVIIDKNAGSGVVPYLPLPELQKKTN